MNRQDYIAEVKKLVPGSNHPIGEPEIVKAIAQAIAAHSRNKPRELVEDMDGDGGFEYDLADLDYWTEGFSAVRQVEYPVDDTEEEPSILTEEQFLVYKKPSGTVLRFLDDEPAATEDMRITYTALHTCDDSDCTVEGIDDEAVQALAAANFCGMLATAYAQDEDSTIQADSVDHKSKSANYQARARALKKLYDDHIGLGSDAPAASVMASPPASDRTRLTH